MNDVFEDLKKSKQRLILLDISNKKRENLRA